MRSPQCVLKWRSIRKVENCYPRHLLRPVNNASRALGDQVGILGLLTSPCLGHFLGSGWQNAVQCHRLQRLPVRDSAEQGTQGEADGGAARAHRHSWERNLRTRTMLTVSICDIQSPHPISPPSSTSYVEIENTSHHLVPKVWLLFHSVISLKWDATSHLCLHALCPMPRQLIGRNWVVIV